MGDVWNTSGSAFVSERAVSTNADDMSSVMRWQQTQIITPVQGVSRAGSALPNSAGLSLVGPEAPDMGADDFFECVAGPTIAGLERVPGFVPAQDRKRTWHRKF